MEFTHLLKAMQFSWKACLITLISLSGLFLQDAADPDNDPQVTVYVKSGQAAELFYHKANRTHLDHFKGYRVFKDNTSFAYMNNGSQTGNCSNSQLADFCSKKVEFRVYNATDLRLKINETSVNDSGCYAVEYRYEGLLSDHKHVIRLNVTLIVKEGEPTVSSPSQDYKSTKGNSHIPEPSSNTKPTPTSSAISHSVPVGIFVFLSSLFYLYVL